VAASAASVAGELMFLFFRVYLTREPGSHDAFGAYVLRKDLFRVGLVQFSAEKSAFTSVRRLIGFPPLLQRRR